MKALKQKKLSRMIFLLLIAMSVLVGCTKDNSTQTNSNQNEPKKTEEQAKERNKELVVVLEAEPTSLDPQNSTDGNSGSVQEPIFEGLLTFDTEMKLVPALARNYSFNEEATAITFELKEGVTFHDGTPFNAEVVKENLDFVRNEKNGLARAGFFEFISEVVVDSEYKVTIKSKEPNSAMAAYMAHTAATFKSAEEIKKKQADANYNLDRNPVGTGPFQFVEWRDGVHVKLKASNNYWDKENKPKLSGIVYKPVTEANTRVNMLKTGEADVVTKLPTQNVKELSDTEGIDVFTGPSLNVFYVGMSLKHEKYKDVRVRQALNYAVNKDQLISQVNDGYGVVADSAIAPGVAGYAKQEAYEYDLEKAKQLLAEAGYEKGFKATLWTRKETEFIAVAENVAIQLKAAGIEVEVQAFESGTLFDKLDNNQGTDLWIGRWSPSTGEADWGLRPNFGSDRVPPNYNNSGFYQNKEVDQLLKKALQAPTEDGRQENYAKIQGIVYKEAPWIFLYVPENAVAKRNNVDNVTILPSDDVRVTGAEKK
ncbi:glutathione ABC transporter substrate-binding protein [Neobacillus sp. YIM B06451]|uniref:glutathione ABC transporter substrate-binding protein n=1 Tax=Neobacillus sp. YIM B06451 TaxID=3070994 RepID=UPI00292D22AC|nr:glutathione ABC transporter substrate-binding protein [Neobacillus sp. YIM B06451]